MAERTSPPRRRGSIVEMLNPRSSATGGLSTSSSNVLPSNPGSQRKSMSMALGLSVDNPNSPYTAFSRQRRASISTTSSPSDFRNSFDENAIIEEDDRAVTTQTPPSPTFARRLSFGAQAMRDVRAGTFSGSNAGRRPPSALFTLDEANDHNTQATSNSHGTAKTTGEGFNWTESMRDRTRKPSISTGNPFSSVHNRNRSMNMSASAPEPTIAPPKEMPKSPPVPVTRLKKPDHLGERMLRGDFLMD